MSNSSTTEEGLRRKVERKEKKERGRTNETSILSGGKILKKNNAGESNWTTGNASRA